ncbi:FecR family protein [Chitinophaga caseinilytica]|uniref:FecR family protein n=1 Tax=Chitinophaga caseinilytica TaxID=2267521 RepID=UPI003C30299D
MPKDYQDIADLLADESFIRYCKGGPPEDVARWEAFRTAGAANRDLADAARERFFALFDALAQADLAEQEARLAGKLFPEGETPVIPLHDTVRQRRFRPLLRWAAVILPLVCLAAGAWLFSSKHSSQEYHTLLGERKNFHLPDGSFVRLNAGSSLRLGKDFGDAYRDLYLEGEAFFDVKHNKDAPFIVHAADMDVRAVGTAFNVRSYGGDSTETVLIQGVVEITLKGQENRKIVLRPDHKIRWAADHAPVEQQKVRADSTLVTGLARNSDGDIPETGWVNNKLIFENETLTDIAVKLERWYGAQVVISDESLGNYRFTGTFEQEGISDVLDFCRESRHFNYKISPGEKPVVTIFR